MLGACAFAGLAISTFEAKTSVPSVPQRARLLGEVLEAGERNLVLRVSAVGDQPAQFSVVLWSGEPHGLVGGETIATDAKLHELTAPDNPGQADFTEARRRAGVIATGSLIDSSLVVLSPAPRFRRVLESERQALRGQVEALSPSPDAAALLLTLSAGMRANLDDRIEDDFARSGLAHVLSVSGLHVAVLALALMVSLRWLLVRLPIRRLRRIDARRIAAPLSMSLLWAYVLFTGWQGPAVRSGLMASVLLVGVMLRRRADGLQAVALAAIAMEMFTPDAVADLSMRLSFVAVLSLMTLAPALRAAIPVSRPRVEDEGWRRRLIRLREAVLMSLCTSVAVMSATAPMLATAFHRVGWAGLVANVVCMPLCAALSVLAAGGAALFVVAPWLAAPVLWAGAWASELLLAAARFFASLPGAAWDVPAPPGFLAAAWLVGLAFFAFARGRVRCAAALAPVALTAMVLWPRLDPEAPMTVTFLAVGHGDAVVISSRGEHALVDGGGVPGGSDVGRRIVLPYLRQRRIGRLKLAALSHPHPDHALGLTSALRSVPVDRLWLPRGSGTGALITDLLGAAAGADVERVTRGSTHLRVGDAELKVLAPPRDLEGLDDENDRSIVLRLEHGDVSFLLTGDIEAPAEDRLTDIQPVTVMKAPHHGSRTSSTDRFVQQAHPRHVVFCVGRHNRFGFPHSEVVETYQSVGARCWRTDVHGAVTFESDGHDVKVVPFHDAASTTSAEAAGL
ncbi:MAG: DNA internalization-related competence protein ComEC/Rec2 [Myxococcaceae bacterium]